MCIHTKTHAYKFVYKYGTLALRIHQGREKRKKRRKQHFAKKKKNILQVKTMASEEMKSKEVHEPKDAPRSLDSESDYEGTTMFVKKTKRNHNFYSRLLSTV